ncbi:hypothetical protein [Noviherbaspirillum sedimenti]|uniref:Uncharacterized protein n=1 Tax=Noviherbaspirillum sedimenti TaxID=2320865 RepID=A0A3A3GLR1_9BURK|nr:hypothetical protein [Noviherbaspirillum sedimenti]RJG01920.1 hypothetical protein D3878_10285 [Noviherbaspirillum sedimenti]
MEHVPTQKVQRELDEINEKLRKDVIRTIEPYGLKKIVDLGAMSESERTKWFFWNLHENIDEIRKCEPALIGQVIRTQLTVSDGQSLWTEKCGLEKRLELSCKWQLLVKDGTYQNEEAYAISDGWIDLSVGQCPPPHPTLQENQKGYLDSDSKLYPNQLYLYGWITEGVWDEVKDQLYNASANCHTDIFIRDNFLFPVKPEHNFVTGPAGSIGIINIEFRVSSQPRLTSWVKQ